MDDFDDFDDADYAALDNLCAQYSAPQQPVVPAATSDRTSLQVPATSTLGCVPQPCLAQQRSTPPSAQQLLGLLPHHTGHQENRHQPVKSSIPTCPQSSGEVLKEHNAVSLHAAAKTGASQVKASGAGKQLQHQQHQLHQHHHHEHQQQQQQAPAPALVKTLSPSPELQNGHRPQATPQLPASLGINGAQAQPHSNVPAPKQLAPPMHQAPGSRSGHAQAHSTAPPLHAPTPPQGASGGFQHLRFSGGGAPPPPLSTSAASLGFPTLASSAPAPVSGTQAPFLPARPWHQQQQQQQPQPCLLPPSVHHRHPPLHPLQQQQQQQQQQPQLNLLPQPSSIYQDHQPIQPAVTSSGGGATATAAVANAFQGRAMGCAPNGSGGHAVSGGGSGSALAQLLGSGPRGPLSGPASHTMHSTAGGGDGGGAAAGANPFQGMAMGAVPARGAGSASVNPFQGMAMGSGGGQRTSGAVAGPPSGVGSVGTHVGSGGGAGGVDAGSGGRPTAAQPVMGPPVTVFGTVGLASSTHCSLKLSRTTPQLQEVLRSFQGSSFDIATCAWMVPIRSYPALRERMDNTPGVNMSWKDLTPIVHNVLKATAVRKDDITRYERVHTSVDDAGQSLDERMMPFQREGVRFGLKLGGRVLIGDEMGLGKTVQGCALLKCYEDEWPALIITPSSLRQQWCLALQQWSNALECDVQVVFDKNDMDRVKRAAGAQAQKGARSNVSLPFRILIISYDYVSKMSEILLSLGFKVVLLDEAHYIKSYSSQRTKASLPLLQRAKRAILLTGTPALSKPVDLMTLMQALAPGAHIKLNDFAARYCAGDMYSKTAGAKNQEELFRLITATMMIRRRKDDVLKQLPPKRRQQVYLKVDERDLRKLKGQQEELSGLKEVLSSVSTHTGGLLAGLRMEQQQAIMRMYHDTAKLKVAAVQEYIKDLLESDTKFLVFAHHHSLLDGMEKAINTAKKGYIRIDGTTDARQREELRARFQGDDSVKVAVLGIAAAGVGLTLTAASTVVFAELSWVPGQIMQAEDRVHRIGQESNSVNIHFLLVKGTIDDIMWDTVQHKLTNVGKVLDGKEDSLAVASKSTVERSSGGPGPMDAFLTARRPDASNASGSLDTDTSPAYKQLEVNPTQNHRQHTTGPVLNGARPQQQQPQQQQQQQQQEPQQQPQKSRSQQPFHHQHPQQQQQPLLQPQQQAQQQPQQQQQHPCGPQPQESLGQAQRLPPPPNQQQQQQQVPQQRQQQARKGTSGKRQHSDPGGGGGQAAKKQHIRTGDQ